jgi:hypothetical protein
MTQNDDLIIVGSPARVADTATLARLAHRADEKNYNRKIDWTVLVLLDPKGFHVIKPIVTHHHAAGKEVAPHVRCMVLCKFSDDDQPHEVWLDIERPDFNALRLAVDVAAERITSLHR